MPPPTEDRWVEVSPSQFSHEAEGLSLVRQILPNQPPFRAWSNFEFRDGRGRWHEVDLLVLGRGRLHLVELKWYAGRLRGDDHTWLRDGKRAEDSHSSWRAVRPSTLPASSRTSSAPGSARGE